MKHELPKLDYAYNALEPYIDEKTMTIHHTKHHQTYVDKLNAALEPYAGLQKVPVQELLKSLNTIPEAARNAVRNHGGGHYNHSMFWKILKKDVAISGKIKDAIDKEFGSIEEFKKKFTDGANTVFGSGWTWLVVSDGKLEIVNTSNQDNPISQNKIPILGIDLWEHAFYLLRQNKRPEWIEAFFNVINWDFVEKLYEHALHKKEFLQEKQP
jgi:Fe-Mn family superoxide dismutase